MSWNLLLGATPEAVATALDEIRERSVGRVQKPFVLSERADSDGLPRPEPGGPRCERLFGPVRDHRCRCSKYVGSEHAGVRCEKCGVEVIGLAARDTRWAHIETGAFVVHPVQARTIGAALGVTPDEVMSVARGESWIEGDEVKALSDDADEAFTQAMDHCEKMGVAALRLAVESSGAALTFINIVAVPPPSERPLMKVKRGWGLGPFDRALESLLARSARLELLGQLSTPPTHPVAEEKWRVQRAFEALVAAAREGAGLVAGLGEAEQKASVLQPANVTDDDDFEHATGLFWNSIETLHLAKNGELFSFSNTAELVSSYAFSMRPIGELRAWTERYWAWELQWYMDDIVPLAAMDLQTGEWMKEWPEGLRAWTLDPLDEQWCVLHDRLRGKKVEVRATEYDPQSTTSACGNFLWLGNNIYDLRASSFGALYASSGELFEERAHMEDRGASVLRDGQRVALQADEFEDAWGGVVDVLSSTEVDDRALVDRADGLLMFKDGLLVDERGTRLLVEMPYEAIAFSPTGSHLAWVDEDAIHILDTQDYSLRSRPLPNSGES